MSNERKSRPARADVNLLDHEKDFISKAVASTGVRSLSGYLRRAGIKQAESDLGKSLNEHLNAIRKVAA